MKKAVLTLALTSFPLLAGQWYTATAFTAGTKYFSEFSSNIDIRLEQYFIHDSTPKLYYKAGYFKEQLYRWALSDGNVFIDGASNVLAGAGYNLLTVGNFFVDGGLSFGYKFDESLITGTASGVDYTSDYDGSSLTTFVDLGIGYSIGRYSIKADILYAAAGEVSLIDATDGTVTSDPYTFSRLHVNLGVAYWW